MKLISLDLDSFGQFRHVEIPFGEGLNLILGNNEAGKSTIVDAILATLFGLRKHTSLEKALRARYQPLAAEERFRAALVIEAGAGMQFLVSRDFTEPRKSVFRTQPSGTGQWREAGDIDAVLRELRFGDMALFRGTLLITASQAVIDAENEKAVARAIGAKLASGQGDVTANQALKKLTERLYVLTHKERKMALERRGEFEARRQELDKLEGDLAQLEDDARRAEEEAATARSFIEKYRPIVDGFRATERIHADYQAKLEEQRKLLAELGRAEAAIKELERAAGELDQFTLEAREVLTEANLARLAELDARLAETQRNLDDTSRRKRGLEEEAAAIDERLLEAGRALEQVDSALFNRERLGEVRAALSNTREAEADVAIRAAGLEQIPLVRGNWMLAGVGSLIGLLSLAALLPPIKVLAQLPPAFCAAGVILGAALAGAWAVKQRRAAHSRRQRADAESLLADAKRRLDRARLRFDQVSAGYSPHQFEAMVAEVEQRRQTLADLETAAKSIRGRVGVLRVDQLGETLGTLRQQRQQILDAAGAKDAADFQSRWRRYHNVRAKLQQEQGSLGSALAGRSIEELKAAAAALAAEVFTLKNAHDTAKARVATFTPAEVFSWEEQLGTLNLPVLEERARGLRAKLDDFRNRIVKDNPLELDDAIAAVSERLARQEFEARALELAIATLRDAMEEVQGSLVPRIEKRAVTLLSRLTGGRHRNLKLSAQPDGLEIAFSNPPAASGQAPNEPPGPSRLGRHHLSSATSDQLYLALRVALAEALFDRESVPLIVDDPFLTYDAERFRAGCRLLAEIAEHRQVIWVTKDHEEAVAGLSNTAYHVVDLNLPAYKAAQEAGAAGEA